MGKFEGQPSWTEDIYQMWLEGMTTDFEADGVLISYITLADGRIRYICEDDQGFVYGQESSGWTTFSDTFPEAV